jgi:hypothetical protein
MNEMLIFLGAYLTIGAVAMIVVAWTEAPLEATVEPGGEDIWEDLGEFR